MMPVKYKSILADQVNQHLVPFLQGFAWKFENFNDEDIMSWNFKDKNQQIRLSIVVLQKGVHNEMSIGFVFEKAGDPWKLIDDLLFQQRGLKPQLEIAKGLNEPQWASECNRVVQLLMDVMKAQVSDVLSGQKWYNTPFDWQDT